MEEIKLELEDSRDEKANDAEGDQVNPEKKAQVADASLVQETPEEKQKFI